MKLFKTGEDKELQTYINKGIAKVADIKKLSDLGAGYLAIDKLNIKFVVNEKEEDLNKKYEVINYLAPDVNYEYGQEIKKTAIKYLASDFKKNLDSMLGLYKIFHYNKKYALLRKFHENAANDLASMDPEEKEEYVNKRKNIFNINYKGDSYSIIKIIPEKGTWSDYEKLSEENIINDLQFENIIPEPQEEAQEDELMQTALF